MQRTDQWPGPADVAYFEEAQAGAWGDMLRGFLRFASVPVRGRLLDVGTGPGLLPRLALAGGAAIAVGVDDSLPMLRRAQELAAEELEAPGVVGSVPDNCVPAVPAWLCADGGRLPFAAGAFDAVTATNLLFLLPDPAVGFAELARVARRGGIVAVLNPTDVMSQAAAERFADQRGLDGFARFSFVNYGRLAEAHHRLSTAAWMPLAQRAGLHHVRSETRAGGLVAFVRGVAGGGIGE